MRPDEAVRESENELDKKYRSNVKSGISAAATVASTVAPVALASKIGGSALASRIAPFINEYVPVDLAMKGINKLSPQLGNFLKKGQEAGLDVKEGLNFIKESLGNDSAKNNKNIIEQESKELHDFVLNEIKKGTNPMAAGLMASNEGKFKGAIKKLKEKTKLNWGDLVNQIFGSGEKALENKAQNLQQMIAPSQTPMEQPAQQTPQQARDMAEMGDAGMMRGEQPQQGGQGEQKLMAAIQQLRKLRGG